MMGGFLNLNIKVYLIVFIESLKGKLFSNSKEYSLIKLE